MSYKTATQKYISEGYEKDSVKSLMDFHKKLKNDNRIKPEHKNIDLMVKSMKFEDFRTIMKCYEDSHSDVTRDVVRKDYEENEKIICENDYWYCKRLRTYEHAQLFRGKTRWCICSGNRHESEINFRAYSRVSEGIGIFIFTKKDFNQKDPFRYVALHVNADPECDKNYHGYDPKRKSARMWFDAEDDPVPESVIDTLPKADFEEICTNDSLSYEDKFIKRHDGTFDYLSGGVVKLSKKYVVNGELIIAFNKFVGDLDLSNLGLRTLRGCPVVVEGKLDVSRNPLTSLRGVPKRMREFYCDCRDLRTTEGIRQSSISGKAVFIGVNLDHFPSYCGKLEAMFCVLEDFRDSRFIRELNLMDCYVESLCGLKDGLRKLKVIGCNGITKLCEFPETINDLVISGCGLRSFEGLNKLPKIKEFDVSRNELTSFEHFPWKVYFPGNMNISGNRFEDFSGFPKYILGKFKGPQDKVLFCGNAAISDDKININDVLKHGWGKKFAIHHIECGHPLRYLMEIYNHCYKLYSLRGRKIKKITIKYANSEIFFKYARLFKISENERYELFKFKGSRYEFEFIDDKWFTEILKIATEYQKSYVRNILPLIVVRDKRSKKVYYLFYRQLHLVEAYSQSVGGRIKKDFSSLQFESLEGLDKCERVDVDNRVSESLKEQISKFPKIPFFYIADKNRFEFDDFGNILKINKLRYFPKFNKSGEISRWESNSDIITNVCGYGDLIPYPNGSMDSMLLGVDLGGNKIKIKKIRGEDYRNEVKKVTKRIHMNAFHLYGKFFEVENCYGDIKIDLEERNFGYWRGYEPLIPKKVYGNVGYFAFLKNPSNFSKYVPEEVFGDYEVSGQGIHSMEGFPKRVHGNLVLTDCQYLSSCDGIPEFIGGNIIISGCPELKKISGLPDDFNGKIFVK